MRESGGPEAHPVPCPACLGARKCWVCLGTGRLPQREGRSSECHACRGSGRCPRCAAALPVQRDRRRDRAARPARQPLATGR